MFAQLQVAGRCVGPQRRGGTLGIDFKRAAVGVEGAPGRGTGGRWGEPRDG